MKLLRTPAAVLAAALSLSACTSDSTGFQDADRGVFAADFTGDRRGTLDGTAVSASSVGSGQQDEILLTDMASRVQILVLHLDDFFAGGSATLEDGT
ncbi:MAG TPA: hypothetical protein VFQ39_20330, partial [Longimicrobium sp.]|nr:hypothetical protein [Longimicrobium sp.]